MVKSFCYGCTMPRTICSFIPWFISPSLLFLHLKHFHASLSCALHPIFFQPPSLYRQPIVSGDALHFFCLSGSPYGCPMSPSVFSHSSYMISSIPLHLSLLNYVSNFGLLPHIFIPNFQFYFSCDEFCFIFVVIF